MKTKAQAEIAAIKLKSKLKGDGWVTSVWENLGWHCKAMKTLKSGHTLRVCSNNYDTGGAPYSCLFGTNGAGNYTLGAGDHFSHSDPNKCVEHAVQQAHRTLHPLMFALAEAQMFVASAKKKKGVK